MEPKSHRYFNSSVMLKNNIWSCSLDSCIRSTFCRRKKKTKDSRSLKLGNDKQCFCSLLKSSSKQWGRDKIQGGRSRRGFSLFRSIYTYYYDKSWTRVQHTHFWIFYKFENTVLFLRFGLQYILVCQENGTFQNPSNQRNLKTPAFRFRVHGKHFENG